MFDINLSMYNYKYYVNEEEKTVVAKLELDVDRIDEATLLVLSLSRNVKLPDYFVGVAHCKDGDTWNVEVGKKIARAKAKRTYKRFMLNCTKSAKKFLKQTQATVEREESKYRTDINNLTDLIKGTDNKTSLNVQLTRP